MVARAESPALTVIVVAEAPTLSLAATLESLGQQTELEYELAVIEAGAGPENGVATALQRAIEAAGAPLVTVLRAGDVVMHGALQAVQQAFDSSPETGVVHSWWIPLDRAGGISESAADRQWDRLHRWVPPGLDHRRAVAERGNIVQALPTFRRELLLRSGTLSGACLEEALYGAVLRVLNRSQGQVVPRLLCGRPSQDGRVWPIRGPRPYLVQLAQCYVAMRKREAGYLRRPRYRLAGLALAGGFRNLLEAMPNRWIELAYGVWGRLADAARSWKQRMPHPYQLLVSLLQYWPLGALRPRRRPPAGGAGPRVAYVQWHYPYAIETFIRRELEALHGAGLDLEVFAVEPPPGEPRPEAAASGVPVTYFGSPSARRARALARRFLRARPWTAVQARLFVTRHRYRDDKTWKRDGTLFGLAAQLAAALAKRGVTHVHASWADNSATLALVAARLLGLRYSVQARASEIHRTRLAAAASERLRYADFVVTNSRYNETYLRRQLGRRSPPIHVIYDGLDPAGFPAAGERRAAGRPLILAVGRLIEPKGFRYLALALRVLRDRGLAATVEIIGGPQEPLDTVSWVELRRLQRELELEEDLVLRGEQPFSEVLASLQRAVLFALPCVRGRDGSHDITPNALLEAMALGMPVVSTTSGAIPELVEHGVSGLLVPPGDATALADALERLLRDASLGKALGDAARRSVAERFDVHRNALARDALFRASAPE